MGESHETIQSSPYRNLILFGGPVIAYALLIFFLSSLQNFGREVQFFWGFDKIVHFVEYFFFGALICRWFSAMGLIRKRGMALILTIMIGTGYALSDEWHQAFVPGRDASLWDVLFDSVGAAAGAAIYRRLRLTVFDEAKKQWGGNLFEKRTDHHD